VTVTVVVVGFVGSVMVTLISSVLGPVPHVIGSLDPPVLIMLMETVLVESVSNALDADTKYSATIAIAA
jgi:hypothetical protein